MFLRIFLIAFILVTPIFSEVREPADISRDASAALMYKNDRDVARQEAIALGYHLRAAEIQKDESAIISQTAQRLWAQRAISREDYEKATSKALQAGFRVDQVKAEHDEMKKVELIWDLRFQSTQTGTLNEVALARAYSDRWVFRKQGVQKECDRLGAVLQLLTSIATRSSQLIGSHSIAALEHLQNMTNMRVARVHLDECRARYDELVKRCEEYHRSHEGRVRAAQPAQPDR